MPGSYRPLTHLLKNYQPEKVKHEGRANEEESESSSVQENQDCLDGKWTPEQNLKFAIFVHYYENIFTSKRKRKMCKIFKSLSEYLEKRTATQCRSHFQKMMAKYKSVTRLKKYHRNLVGNDVYAKQFEDFKELWEKNHKPMENVYPELKEAKQIAIQTDPPEEIPPAEVRCENCRQREERQGVDSPYFPYQMNSMMYWLNGFQSEPQQGGYMMWMPGQQPQ